MQGFLGFWSLVSVFFGAVPEVLVFGPGFSRFLVSGFLWRGSRGLGLWSRGLLGGRAPGYIISKPCE